MKGEPQRQMQANWLVFDDARVETAFLLHLSKQTHWTSARLRFIVSAMWFAAVGRFTYAFLWEHHPRSYGWAFSSALQKILELGASALCQAAH